MAEGPSARASPLPDAPAKIDLLLTPKPPVRTAATYHELLQLPLVRHSFRPHDQTANQRSIIHETVPSERRMRLIITREQESIDVLYRCNMEQEEPLKTMFLMTARRRVCDATYFDIWVEYSVFKLQRTSSAYIGYLKSAPFDPCFTLIVATEPPDRTKLNIDLAALFFAAQQQSPTEPYLWHDITFLIVGTSSQEDAIQPNEASDANEELTSKWKKKREPSNPLANLTVLENNRTLWNFETGRYLLDYVPKAKQTQGHSLCLLARKETAGHRTPSPTEDSDIMAAIVSERIKADTVVVDFTSPLTAFAAFAITMAVMDGKAAQDFLEYFPGWKLKTVLSEKDIQTYSNSV